MIDFQNSNFSLSPESTAVRVSTESDTAAAAATQVATSALGGAAPAAAADLMIHEIMIKL